ncbi:MAG: hypothetical protein QOF92_1570 [Pseudonocardiales bacterium]|nr:hypothetical protein [Pseudonocardiales bacterium]
MTRRSPLQAFCCVDRIEDAHGGDQQALDDDHCEESRDAGMDERETEWEERSQPAGDEFDDQLGTDFDLRIDAAGPNFGNEVLLDALADSADVATLVGARDRFIWPTNYDLRRIATETSTPPDADGRLRQHAADTTRRTPT